MSGVVRVASTVARTCPKCKLQTILPEGSAVCPIYHGKTGSGYCPLFVDGVSRAEVANDLEQTAARIRREGILLHVGSD